MTEAQIAYGLMLADDLRRWRREKDRPDGMVEVRSRIEDFTDICQRIEERRMSGRKIIEGLEQALDYAKVQSAIHEWIRLDVPVSVKMTLMPKHVAKLADRICGSITTTNEREDT